MNVRFARLAFALVVAFILLFGFSPISRALLRSVDGSFSQVGYSSLALKSPLAFAAGAPAGDSIPVKLGNHTGRATTYHWNATQRGVLISAGVATLSNGQSATIPVPSRGAGVGPLQISLLGTRIFVTVSLVAP
jgi:hypothetical protein